MSTRLYLPDYWEPCKPAQLRARLAAIAPGLGQVLPAADPALAGLLLTRDCRALLVYDYERLEALMLHAARTGHGAHESTEAHRQALLHAESDRLAGTWAPRVVHGVLRFHP